MRFPYPIFFSQEEFNAYLSCISKIKVGDVVWFYTSETGSITTARSPTQGKAIVICDYHRAFFNKGITLGVSVGEYGFIKGNRFGRDVERNRLKTDESYPYNWNIRTSYDRNSNYIQDGLIFKVEKASEEWRKDNVISISDGNNDRQ